ncbi:MAG: tRNA (adenosine(37)-N6)-threonylcarbamoyltransferase complex transferase subunit TsaD [Syntrophobacteraceae bacterium]
MVILGIETSCDETAAAVVECGNRILSDVVASQAPIHGPYGGVVPELASRKHLEYIIPVIERALKEADYPPQKLDVIAATQGPGLVGALLVGLGAAKAMAYALGIPFIPVNHLEGHIQAAFLGDERPDGPFVCLVVSGGHTALYRVEPNGTSLLLGATRDDAAGEAFDKVAKLLDIGYPGGIVIDRLASAGNPEAFHFPRSRFDRESLEFSFSGLKTAAANFIRQNGRPGTAETSGSYALEDFAASFQEAIVDVLVSKSFKAAEQCGLSRIAAVGGVAANSGLRQKLADEARARGMRLYLPPVRFCTDNAVMIASAAYHKWMRSGFQADMLEVDAFSR